MALVQVKPFIGTDEAGKALNEAHRSYPVWRAYFTNGERWTFTARDHQSAMNDARFWADFTGRELLALAQLD